jgi:hypothetical protein
MEEDAEKRCSRKYDDAERLLQLMMIYRHTC